MNKLSFIIPVYNCKNYLQECIESIEKIGLPEYEILLIDDGSTDGSGELCDNITNIRNHVRCIHQSNQGVSVARNVGLDHARGEYVLFIDSDDSFDSQGMKKVMNYLTDETIDLIIYGMSFEFYYKGMVYRRDDMQTPLSGIFNEMEWISYLRDLYFANSLSPIWNKVYKRTLLVNNKLKFKEDMFLYEDLEFSLRCLAYSRKVLFIPDVLYHYRQSEDEGNAGRRLKRIAHIPELIDRIEVAAEELLKKKSSKKDRSQIDTILLSLYLVLAREKINVSRKKEIRQICDDFIAWFQGQDIQLDDNQKDYVKLLLNRQVTKIILNRTYISLRHKIAVKMKSLCVKK